MTSTGPPRYYALRRLSPFLGTVQVVEVADGRAISGDGRRWQIEVLSQAPVRQPLWGDIGPASSERRFFTYGLWTHDDGIERVPVNPVLGDQSRHPALVPLLHALEHMPPAPFALEDRLELWLLDKREYLPLALLKSLRAESAPPVAREPDWHPGTLGDNDFRAPSLAGTAEDEGSQLHRELVAELVRDAAGRPVRAQWFLRQADDGGAGRGGWHLSPVREDRTLEAAAFPELLLREHWPTTQAQKLIADFLDWQAPMLLTLPGLTRATRSRLEHAATRRALVLYAYRRLIPEVLNRHAIDAALVEAVIRRTA